jgi:hypothetical protein
MINTAGQIQPNLLGVLITRLHVMFSDNKNGFYRISNIIIFWLSRFDEVKTVYSYTRLSGTSFCNVHLKMMNQHAAVYWRPSWVCLDNSSD